MEIHEISYDVVVVGGGLSGVCAALAAARSGAATCLIHDRPSLGGNTSSEIRVHASGADESGRRPHAREAGIVDELRLEEVSRNPQRCAQMWDLILYEKCVAEDNLKLYLNATAVDVSVEDGAITSVTVDRQSTEDRFIISGRFFIDCTGDGRVASDAGAAYRTGREGPDEFNEPHAQGPDAKSMGASLMWVAENTGVPVPFKRPEFAHIFAEADLPHRISAHDIDNGYWWIEYGGERDTIKDKEEIRDELLRCMMGVWAHIKDTPRYGAQNWVLKWFGFLPGHRESRRITGDHILTENDLMECRLFEDRVCHGGWPMDTHPPGGIYSDEPPCTFIHTPDIYSIPLRALYSKDIANLFMAGRCISATHMAMASTRLAATGGVMGQAVGTAAAMCCRHSWSRGELVADHIGQLQQQLLRDDCYVIDLPSADEADLARRATVTASSEAPGCEAAKVIDGETRCRHEDLHQWASDPEQGIPQWVELALPKAAEITEIHLTFDSGYMRPLTLTESDSYNSRMVRQPQPETVADYVIEVGNAAGEYAEVVRETGNYLRKRVHRISAAEGDRVRVTVNRTNGDPVARIYEIRIYE